MFSVINNIVRLKIPEKLFIINLICLLPELIPTVNAASIGKYVGEMIQFPTFILGENDELILVCRTDQFSKSIVYGTFTSQTGAFIPVLGLLFTVAVYGTTSVFGYMTTCLLDDIVILTSSLAPILSWYTLVKPIWLSVLIKEINIPDYIDNADKNLEKISLLLVGSFTLILILMAIVRYYFSKRYNENKTYKSLLITMKTYIIWLYFFHSLEVITFSILEYKFIFLDTILKSMIETREGNNTLNINLGAIINLLFLNWFMNACYLLTSFYLVVTYHFPDLENIICNSNRSYQGFIRKKTFFFTVTLSIGHIFFEYNWFCTPPFISIVFNTIITTVLTRSIASFFSNNGDIKNIHKHGSNDRVYAPIRSKDIRKINHFYKNDNSDKINHFYKNDNSDKSSELKRYRVGFKDGCIYTYSEEDEKYFYVMLVNESVYFVDLGKLEGKKTSEKSIVEAIKVFMVEDNKDCLAHGCEKIEEKKRFIINEHIKGEENKITEIIEQKLEISEHLKKVEKYKITEIKGHVLVNVLETGFLSYIIYSHRGSKRGEKSIILYIIVIFTIVSTLFTLCGLFGLYVSRLSRITDNNHDNNHHIINSMVVCALLALFELFLLSKFFFQSDDNKDNTNNNLLQIRNKLN